MINITRNYQQFSQTPALLVTEHFRDSFLKPYATPSAKQSEPCFHWTWKYFIKKYDDVFSPSFQLHHTVKKDFNSSSQAWTGFLNYRCFHKELSNSTPSLIHVWISHQISTLNTAAWFLAIENI